MKQFCVHLLEILIAQETCMRVLYLGLGNKRLGLVEQ